MKQDKNATFLFPLMAYKGNILHFAKKEEYIETCTTRGFKSGFFENLHIIDSAGKEYIIKEAIKIRFTMPIWQTNLLKGRRLKVKLIINKINNYSLENFKKKILKTFKMEEHFWNSDGEIEIKKALASNAKSHLEIIEYLSNYFYKTN